MSNMSNLVIDIQSRIDEGQDPYQIAVDLGIPLHWIYEALELLDVEEYNPYATINS